VIPVSDSPHSRTFPFVNIALILANIAVFIYELTLSDHQLNDFFRDYGVVPKELSHWAGHPSGLSEPETVFTSAFIHGGWLHIIGNMLFLWVFGDNVEDSLGHLKYLLFYAVATVAAVSLQVALMSDDMTPTVGASGAISGVLGAYLVLYPKAMVTVLLWFFLVPVPAVLLIGIWFVLQLFTGIASMGTATGASEGVAVWAHVGGFVAGFLIVLITRPLLRRREPAPVGRFGRRSVW